MTDVTKVLEFVKQKKQSAGVDRGHQSRHGVRHSHGNQRSRPGHRWPGAHLQCRPVRYARRESKIGLQASIGAASAISGTIGTVADTASCSACLLAQDVRAIPFAERP
jgi:hypothetical protein